MNIRILGESKVLETHGKAYLLFEDQVWTYRQFDDRVNQAANGFLELGIRKGPGLSDVAQLPRKFCLRGSAQTKIDGTMVPIMHLFQSSGGQYIVGSLRSKRDGRFP
jgi:non-ribosomal peptide synthetase component E (peptide arylation enzyme)